MKKFILLAVVLSALNNLKAQSVMSEAYHKIWNDSLQMQIDNNIEKYRKADAELTLKDIASGTEVAIEQVSHKFIFGSNIFLFRHFDTEEKNRKYEAAFGELFNSATIPFYWKTLEPEKGKPRYAADSPFEYRRPPIDPLVDFCESKGLHTKGHAIIYGIRSWGHPTWMPEDRGIMEQEFESHVKELAKRYKSRVANWDVVNECFDQANRGLMPDDYAYKTYRWAMKYFPKNVTFNTNECDLHWEIGGMRRYVEIVRNHIERGARVDYVGVQMHIFDPQEAMAIAEGNVGRLSPQYLWENLNCLQQTERPVYVSEVTISAAYDTPKGREIQKEITRDLYRLWFSHPNVAGITWWNLVDGGAAPGEPSYSGLFDANLAKKPSYYILDELINKEWTTNLTLTADHSGKISFRGFKGDYKITYKNRRGEVKSIDFRVE